MSDRSSLDADLPTMSLKVLGDDDLVDSVANPVLVGSDSNEDTILANLGTSYTVPTPSTPACGMPTEDQKGFVTALEMGCASIFSCLFNGTTLDGLPDTLWTACFMSLGTRPLSKWKNGSCRGYQDSKRGNCEDTGEHDGREQDGLYVQQNGRGTPIMSPGRDCISLRRPI